MRPQSSLVIVLYFIIGIILYGHTWKNPFVFDDESFIVLNAPMHEIQSVKFYLSNSLMNSGGMNKNAGIYYRPLVGFAYSLLWNLGNGEPWIYHFCQWIFFIGICLTLFFIFREFLGPIPGAVLGAWFLVHPMNSEVVLYASNLADILALLWGVICFWLLIESKTGVSTSKLRLILICLSFLMGLLSKETALIWIFPCLLFALHRGRKSFFHVGLSLGSTFVIYVFLRFYMAGLKELNHNLAPIAQLNLQERLWHIPSIVFYYLRLFIFPYPITLQGDWVIKEISLNNFYFPLLVSGIVIALLGWYVFKNRHHIWIRLCSIIFVFGLAFHLQIIPLGATTATRWFSFSMIGALGIIGHRFSKIPKERLFSSKMFRIGLLVLFMTLGLTTWFRGTDWQSGLRLYEVDVRYQPDSYLSQNNYGVELFRNGFYELSMEHFKKSIELFPNWGTAWNNLGAFYDRAGQTHLAEEHYWKAVQLNYYLAFENYAELLQRQKRWSELKVFLSQRGLNNFPNNPKLRKIASEVPRD